MSYKLLHPLESGPDVRVYLVQDSLNSGISRVLTLFPVDLSNECQRLEFEMLLSWRQSLDHPLLVPVHDLAFRGRRVGFISDFVEGSDLSKKVKTLGSWKERRILALQLSELLAYLHRKRFLCGVLKPTQLFVLSENRLMANFLVPQGKYRGETGNRDWIRYAAPEFLTTGNVNHQTDLYALGMVFYHLFTGHEPYSEQDPNSLKLKQLVASPMRPRKLNPDIPSDIEQLIQDLIQKDPRVRPSSAEYVAAVLKKNCGPRFNVLPRFRSVLVGRDVALANFRKLSQRYLRSPATGFVAISGVSGIGKTTLMRRFETIAKISTAKTFTVSHHRGAGILEAFTQLFNRIAGEAEAPIARATKHPSAFAQDFLQLLAQVSNGQPVVLCVNDLQWMDEGSLAIYKRILESAELPIMVIGNYRVDELPGHWEQLKSELSRRQVLTEIKLRALQEQEVRSLVSNLLGDTPSEEFYKKVLSQCAGNPYYIYEFLRFLQETRQLSFRSGHWQWQPTERKSTVPATVIQNMRARLQGIDSVSSQLLENLSVLERPIPLDWLAQILKMQVSHLEERLNFLERLDFVSISGSLQKPVVLLSHDWLGRVLRGNLAAKERKALHRRIALFFETEFSKEEHSLSRETLVRHFLGAGDGVKVRKHIWGAVEWLEKGHLYKEAAELVEKALHSQAIPRSDWKCVSKAAELFFLSGEIDKCVSLSTRYLSQSPKLGDGKKAFLYWLLARAYLIKGRAKIATGFLQKALPLLRNSQNQELFAEVQGHLLCCLSSLGEYTRAGKIAKELLDRLPEIETSVWVSKQYHALCYYYELRGAVREAAGWEVRSIQVALTEGKLVPSAGRIHNLAFFNLETGQLRVAKKLAHYSLSLADKLENNELTLYAKGTLCCISRKLGQHQKANRVLLELQFVNQRSNRNPYIEAEFYLELAKNSNYQLLPERSLFYLKKCRDILGKDAFQHSLVNATLALGWSWILLGRPDRALTVVSSL
ncbi:MAG: AAA family ATPase, partial [Acidobacteria bacterium]|nr:AAA family ATPase [Acidobacteriota bacterium]